MFWNLQSLEDLVTWSIAKNGFQSSKIYAISRGRVVYMFCGLRENIFVRDSSQYLQKVLKMCLRFLTSNFEVIHLYASR